MRRYDHGGDIYSRSDILFDFSVNTNPLGMPGEVRRALIAEADSFLRYPDGECRRLRGEIAARLGTDDGKVLCGNGAADLIFRICAWKRAREVLVAAPTFSEYERPAMLFGAEIKEHLLTEENGFELTERFAGDITEKTDLVFLCNPNNPTGRLVPENVLDAVLEKCRAVGAVVVVDECFIEFTRAESLLPKLGENPNLLILRAFTKLYAMAGLRLGYLCGAEDMLEQIGAYGASWSVSAAAQAAGTAAIKTEPQWSQRTLEYVSEERGFMCKALTELGLEVFRSDANFLLIKSERNLYLPLCERKILVRSCENFTGIDGRFIRIGLKRREENEMLLNALSEILGRDVI